jgi:hypothetical protein
MPKGIMGLADNVRSRLMRRKPTAPESPKEAV